MTTDPHPLADRTEIIELFDRFARDLDHRAFEAEAAPDDWARSLFTEDVTLAFPVGSHAGIDGVTALHRAALAPFARTQHLHTNYLIDLAGDRADVEFQLLATHVYADPAEPPFQVGDRYTGEVVRTAAGWRIRRLALDVVWTRGRPPAMVAGR